MDVIEKRVDHLRKRFPRSSGRRITHYWRGVNKVLAGRGKRINQLVDLPFWYFLPGLLVKYHKRKPTAADKRFIDDIRWAQHCYYFALRLQDDIYDDQINDRELLFASDHFLLEGERILRKYFGRNSDFWHIKDECLRRSINGITEARRLQGMFACKPARLLPQYANTASVFKVGSAAICVKFSMMDAYKRISAFADEMGIVSQMIDDIEDAIEDLRHHRMNWAVQVALQSSGCKRWRDYKKAWNRITANRNHEYLSLQIYSRLDRARKIANLLGIPELTDHVRHFRVRYYFLEKKLWPEKPGILHFK